MTPPGVSPESKDQAVDSSKLAEQMGEREMMEAAQRVEREELARKEQAKRSATEKDLADKRAAVLVTAGDKPKAPEQPKTPEQPKGPETPADKKATPPAAPAEAVAAAAVVTAATGAETPPPSASDWSTKIKEFFGKMWDSVKGMFAKVTDWIKGFGKKKDDASSAPTAPTTNNTPAPAPAATPPAGPPPSSPASAPETASENWRDVVQQEAARLKIEPAFAMAIVTVEAGKKGLDQNGKPITRFEPHIFNDQLRKRGINEKHATAKGLGERQVDGVSCEGGPAHENACLQKAMEINKEAALNSVSMGLGQIMGFNSKLVGYANSTEMYEQFSSTGGGEAEQVRAMFRLIEHVPAQLNAARRADFGAFTRAYNTSKPGTDLYNRYTAGLERAYRNNGGGRGSQPGAAGNESRAA
jgi:hypothetical protein